MIKMTDDFNRSKLSLPSEAARPSEDVYTFVLTAGVEQTLTLPSEANFVRIKRGNIKKEYSASVAFGFGTTPLSFPTVSGWQDPPTFCLSSDEMLIDLREVDGIIRVLSDEDVKVQMCFYS